MSKRYFTSKLGCESHPPHLNYIIKFAGVLRTKLKEKKIEPEKAIYLENKGKKGLKNESNNWIILSFNNIIVC